MIRQNIFWSNFPVTSPKRVCNAGPVQQSYWASQKSGHDGFHDVDEREPDPFVQYHDDSVWHLPAYHEHCELW